MLCYIPVHYVILDHVTMGVSCWQESGKPHPWWLVTTITNPFPCCLVFFLSVKFRISSISKTIDAQFIKWEIQWCWGFYFFRKFKREIQNTFYRYRLWIVVLLSWFECISPIFTRYRKTSYIRRTLEGNKIVNHSDVVGPSPASAAPTTSSFST